MANKVVSTYYKNQLQEYTQKAGKELPIYQSINEGSENISKHTASVLVDGVEYKSMSTHSTKKQAEQEAAKIAFESIHQENEAKKCSMLLYQDPTLCKSILNEFAIKKKMNKPIYNTRSVKGKIPVFICHITFGEIRKTYKGEEAGSKKMAEHLAARAVIESLSNTLSPIIMSKNKSDHHLPKCSGNLQGENSSGQKRKADTNIEGRSKKRRSGN